MATKFNFLPHQKGFLQHSQSALKNKSFVEEYILEMLNWGTITEITTTPLVINLLLVSTNLIPGKRIILDLRFVNSHIYKNKIKFEDWKCFERYLEGTKWYMFKFDLKNSYHYIYEKYLGFSSEVNGQFRYFIFAVLQLWLTCARFIFTKVVRLLIK